jgi:hypothetical protein
MQLRHRLALLALASASGAFAQINYSGGAYTQNFDTLPQSNPASTTISGRGPHALNSAFGVTGLDGWFGGNPTGSSTSTEFRAHNGSESGGAGRGVLSLGSTSSSDRALGALSTSNQINNFGLYLTNTSGQTLTEFSLSYFGEQWRYGDQLFSSSLTFAYAIFATAPSLDGTGFTNVPALSFTSLIFNTADSAPHTTNTALDGNLPANRSFVSGSINGIEWLPGHTLVLRWTAQDISGQDPALAIDNMSFSAVPEPSAFAALAGLGALGCAATRRRRRA